MLTRKDELTGALIGLAGACLSNPKTADTDALIRSALACTREDAKADDALISDLIQRVEEEKFRVSPGCASCEARCGGTDSYDMSRLYGASPAVRQAKETLLAAIRRIAADGPRTEEAEALLTDALTLLGGDYDADAYLPLTETARRFFPA